MKKLKVLDLFSGIGGFSLGLERTGGFETVAFCEIDEPCHKVLRKHWPDTPIAEDVEGLYKNEDKLIDCFSLQEVCTSDISVICGGFPCQDISVAGKGKGLEGARSGLWYEYKRLIKEIKPKYAIIENVANLRTKGLVTVLQDLWEIGYDSEWSIISACGVGAVHRRERIWIIAYPARKRLEGDRGPQEDSEVCSQEKTSSGSVRSVNKRGERTSPDSNERRQGRLLEPNELEGKEEALWARRDGSEGIAPYTYDLRLWRALTTKEEKQEWRTEASSRFSDVFGQILSVEPSICRSNDGLPRGVDRPRRERVKQLGNSVVPQIPQLIGEAILEYEKDNPPH